MQNRAENPEFYFRWPQGGTQGEEALSDLVGPDVSRRLAQELCILSTTRRGGFSEPPFDTFNLGFHVGDDVEAVRRNRRLLQTASGEAVRFAWLSQVHGTDVADAGEVVESGDPVEADASVTTAADLACVVLTADCLPVIFFDLDATVVAAAHAGWRGLADGVLESTLAAMSAEPSRIVAWLGPSIGPDVFEVGPEVRQRFVAVDPGGSACFRPSPFNKEDRFVADLYELARRRLRSAGVAMIAGGGACTYTQRNDFFSYRRDKTTGRMATAVWLRSSVPETAPLGAE